MLVCFVRLESSDIRQIDNTPSSKMIMVDCLSSEANLLFLQMFIFSSCLLMLRVRPKSFILKLSLPKCR